ncbi:SDR family oxidoreductase [Curvivirga aplysinae]|uniref:SDR family oxidoreductase n=1 Tax=Curvivirga aplysinae TaxID=2529852 RepID=UPI0012BC3B75|nr:SDR family oxidoreductase [Curvivirga aplysinae]MTI09929.1 SDR family oxidoreductase [Curvivirga aplysinae]
MLKNKIALITGGSSGIGLATAKTMLDNGAKVAITGTNEQKLHAAKKELGEDCFTIVADITAPSELEDMYAQLKREFGHIDIMFANAGIAYATPIDTTDYQMFDRLIDVNVKGTFFSIQKTLPLMTEGSSIILNTSWLNRIGAANKSVLSASKAAVRSFARSMSAELLDRRIRVNCVSPGTIKTPIHRSPNETDEHFEEYSKRVGAQVPIGRMGNPEEIASAVLYLASDSSAYLLGTEIVVDGGRAEL